MAVSFKGAHFSKDIILMGVLVCGYPLSYRHVEELMEERSRRRPRHHPTLGREI